MSEELFTFSAGAITMGCGVTALFFLKFWRVSGDWLFIAFALAFGLLGIGQAFITFTGPMLEERSWLYIFRLGAFLLILAAIWRKNRGREQ